MFIPVLQPCLKLGFVDSNYGDVLWTTLVQVCQGLFCLRDTDNF